MKRTALVLTTACLALAGCGGGTDTDASAGDSTSSVGSATHAAATTSAALEPYTVYVNTVTRRGLTPEVKADEAVSVAGNTCDNTVSDMEGLITTIHTLYSTPEEFAGFLTDRADFIDAYCPDSRVVYDAATMSAAGVTVPSN
jgi:hypothetical protein